MPDRDAEIMAMVDEFLVETHGARPGSPMAARRNSRQRAQDLRWMRQQHNVTSTEIPPMPEDIALVTDETPLDDVLHSGVIGTDAA